MMLALRGRRKGIKMLKKIILVFKTHFDIGFTDLASNVIQQYSGSMLRDVIETCRATENMGGQKYVWTMPSWPLKEVCEHCDGELREDLYHFIENGQIVWHALPFTSHTDFCGEEEYLEGLRYGRELSERFHKPYPVSAKMTDVPGHGLMLPEILAGSGIKFLHLGCNEFATPPAVPDLFFWQSRSGKKVLTMYGKGGYGSSLFPPQKWRYPVWMALMSTHDNSGPQSAAFIEEMAHKARKAYPGVEVVCGSMDDFINELSECDLSEIPVITKDMADTWIHGVGSYPAESAFIREQRRRQARLQKLENLLIMCDQRGDSDESGRLHNRYYELQHLYGEHTWGADVKTWLGYNRVYEKEDFLKAKKQENYQFMERSWQEQRERAQLCGATLDRVKTMLEEERGASYFLFISEAASFTGWVSIEAYRAELENRTLLIDKKELPVTVIQGELSCYVTDLPPLVSTELEIFDRQPAAGQLKYFIDSDGSHVENHRYTISFCDGIINSVYDKKLQCNLLEKHGDEGVFSYQYTRYGIGRITEYLRKFAYHFSYWGIQDCGRDQYPECEDESYCSIYKNYQVTGDTVNFYYKTGESSEQYGDAEEIRLEITLPSAGEELFFSLHVNNKQETPFVEAGSIRLPIAISSPHYRLNKPGVVIDPREDIVEDANHVLYAVDNFAAAGNASAGVCVVGKDTPLLSIGEMGIYEWRHSFRETNPDFHFNLFNNMWGTNFPQWLGGSFTFRFALFGYRPEEEASLMERSGDLCGKVEITKNKVTSAPFTIPPHMRLLNIKQEGKGFVLRLKDVLGETRKGCICAPGYSITPVDYYLRASGVQAPSCAKCMNGQKDEYEFEVRPYGLYSFLINNIAREQ